MPASQLRHFVKVAPKLDFAALQPGRAALQLTGSLARLFAALALGLPVYGVMIPTAITRGAWTSRKRWKVASEIILPILGS